MYSFDASTARRLTALALLALATSATAMDRAGILKNLEGEVSVLRQGKSLPALSGAAVFEGDRLITGPKGAAAMTLADGTVLMLAPNTSLELTHQVYDPTTQQGSLLLHLVQGAVRMVTGTLSKTHPELVKLTTSTAVIGVNGTDFIVEANP